MVELVILVKPDMNSIVDALKAKVTVERLGMDVIGVMIKSGMHHIPPEIVADLLGLKIIEESAS